MCRRMKKSLRILLIVLMVLIAGAACLYFRIRAGVDAAVNIRKLEDGFYYMEYRDDYGFDRFLEQGGAASDLDVAKFVGKDLFKGFLYPRFSGGSFGCSTLSARNQEGGAMYGRNFDWMKCTSMVVKSKPENGYASVSTVNLDFLNMGMEYDPEKTVSKIISAAALYAPMDGINEEGLCVAVLMIDDSAVTGQDTGKPDLTTTTAVRLLLDKAASVDEAVQLLEQYDMHSSAGMMLHFALSDKSGRSVAVEYVNHEMSVIETPVVTNFYLTQGDKYGIGTEQSHTRYEMLLERLAKQPSMDMEDMKATMSSVSKNNFGEFASTEWTIVYSQDSGEIRYYHRENYDNYYSFSLKPDTKKSWYPAPWAAANVMRVKDKEYAGKLFIKGIGNRGCIRGTRRGCGCIIHTAGADPGCVGRFFDWDGFFCSRCLLRMCRGVWDHFHIGFFVEPSEHHLHGRLPDGDCHWCPHNQEKGESYLRLCGREQ